MSVSTTKRSRNTSKSSKTPSDRISSAPFHRSIRKRQGQKPKFYFFDPGVKRALDRTLSVPLLPQTSAYGEAFEHLVVLEAHKIAQATQPDTRFSFFRTSDDSSEIDLIVERPGKPIALIEIKSATNVGEKDVGKLKRFEKDFQIRSFTSSAANPGRETDGVRVMPWQRGLREILLGGKR